jgi:hypothetical protein
MMRGDGFAPSPYDPCAYNKNASSGTHVTVVMIVDDLFITVLNEIDHEEFENNIRMKYRGIKVGKGKIVSYIGMTFDFVLHRQVSITMEHSQRCILSECGVWSLRSTPAAPNLFETRNAPKATTEEVKCFRTFVANLLYLAKRVRHECLVAVAFLTTRVHEVDEDDMGKLRRLLG